MMIMLIIHRLRRKFICVDFVEAYKSLGAEMCVRSAEGLLMDLTEIRDSGKEGRGAEIL